MLMVISDWGALGAKEVQQLSINNMFPNMLCEDDIWYGLDDQITQMFCHRSEQIEVEERHGKFDVFK